MNSLIRKLKTWIESDVYSGIVGYDDLYDYVGDRWVTYSDSITRISAIKYTKIIKQNLKLRKILS